MRSSEYNLVTYADGRRVAAWVEFCGHLCVCLSVCIFPYDAARITKLDIDVLHDESWKSIILG